MYYSCEEEECYSCNEEINSWGKNIVALKSIDRPTLVELSLEKQKAAFRTFTLEKRKQLWLEKYDQITTLYFSKQKLIHLKKFNTFLNSYDFSKELTQVQIK